MIYEVYVRGAETRRRILPALLCMLFSVVSLASFAHSAEAAGSCSGVTTSGRWTTYQGPRFTSGGSTITSHAVDPADTRLMFVTNGKVVMVTRDGGCSWKESYAGKDLVTLAGSYTIKNIVIPVTNNVGLLIEQETAGNPRPVLEATSNGGQTWETRGLGLPPVGQPEFIRTAPSNSAIVYVGVDNGGGTLDTLYVSNDEGATFNLRSDVSQAKPNAGITGLEVDPLDPQSLWAYGLGGLYHSTNGGASFAQVPEFTGLATGPVDVVHDSGDPARILVFTNSRNEYRISNNNGGKWFRSDAPGGVDSITHAMGATDRVITAAGKAYEQISAAFTWKNLNAPTPGIKAIVANRSGSISYFGHTARTIERYIPPYKPPCKTNCGPGLPGDPNISLVPPPDVIGKASDLSPDGKKIIIEPGKSKTVPYKVQLPVRPVPLDVYFLVDTSNSMYSTLAGLRRSLQGIVNGLAAEHIDAQFGLGEYRAYPYSCQLDQREDPNFVYRQDTDIAPVSDTLARAIGELTPDAGGVYDSHLGALYQAATGKGQDVFPMGVDNKADVPPGEQATFRDKALRVVINATDEVFGRETEDDGPTGNLSNPACDLQPTPDIPSFEEVKEAFNERNMKQVGLSISNSVESSYPDLARVARDTNTLASVPVDCDGDGHFDIAAGNALVCSLRPTSSQDGLDLVPAVVGLLNSVQDKADVGLNVTDGDEVIENVGPDQYTGVLLQTAKALPYEVTFHCSKKQAGHDFPVQLAAGGTVPMPSAIADATVVCKKLPKEVIERKKKKQQREEQVPPALPPLIPTVGALAAVPPPPPPAPVSNLSSASQAQSQAQAQGATATQEQEEPQLALAQAYFEAQDDAEYAMTSYHGRKNYPPLGASLAMGLVAVSLMGSGLVVTRRRNRKRLVYNYNRY